VARLQQVGEEIWIAEGDCVSFYGFPYPTRAVLIRLASGDLWLWSPIAFEPDLRAEVDALGTLRHLVSPNKIHHLFLKDWKRHYPDALLWGPQSTIAKRRDLSFEAPLTDDAPAAWRGDIEQQWVRGSPLLDEVTFFHKRSRTLILADLSENFSESFLREHWSPWARVIARVWKIVEGWGYAPLEFRLSIFDRSHIRRARARWLELDPVNVVMAHGTVATGNGRAFVEQAFAWV